jgi:LysM repeat protein
MTKVTLTIKDEKTGKYYVIPVLPEKIEYAEGDKQAQTVNIIDLGDVDFLSGTALDSMGWSSFFPGRYDAGYVSLASPLKPNSYKDLFKGWKDNGTPLRVISPEAGISQPVYLASFNWDLRGFEGDIYYVVNFKERRTIKPVQLTVNGTKPTPKPAATTPAKRTAVPKPPAPKYYIVVSGDYLTKIAKKYGISDWRNKLYLPNKAPNGPLGSNPSLLYPGQKLKLP